jgi:HSP20 family protein
MSDLMLWKEQQLRKMKEEIDTLFESLCQEFRTPSSLRTLWEPGFDMSETEDSIVVKTELPGFDPKHFSVTVSEDTLIIKGQELREVIRQGERLQRSGTFSSRLRLPCKVNPEDVEATFKDGILNIVMAKFRPGGMKQVKVKSV